MRREQTFWKEHTWNLGWERWGSESGSVIYWFCDSGQLPVFLWSLKSPRLINRLLWGLIRKWSDTAQVTVPGTWHPKDVPSPFPPWPAMGMFLKMMLIWAFRGRGPNLWKVSGNERQRERRVWTGGARSLCRLSELALSYNAKGRREGFQKPPRDTWSHLLTATCEFMGVWNLQTTKNHPQCPTLLEMYTRLLEDVIPFFHITIKTSKI